MTKGRALITGGAGFIGSSLALELASRGYMVRVLDSLAPQVHGPARRRPPALAPEVELVVGDVRDPHIVRHALAGVDVVVHLAARVPNGAASYRLSDYTSVNNVGTAVLLEELLERPVRRLVVASSMTVYGEGLYRDHDGHPQPAVHRTARELARGDWEPRGVDGRHLVPVPTPETQPARPGSIYALSKYDQEQMCLTAGAAAKLPTVALRIFNVYGVHQAYANPYTGILATFAQRVLAGRPPVVFEDGLQRRDFVHVRDVASACRLALEVPDAAGGVFNVGSGHALTLREVAERMTRVLGSSLAPSITGEYRLGDLRHCTADLALARRVLGYRPSVAFDEGLRELAAWFRACAPTPAIGPLVRHDREPPPGHSAFPSAGGLAAPGESRR